MMGFLRLGQGRESLGLFGTTGRLPEAPAPNEFTHSSAATGS